MESDWTLHQALIERCIESLDELDLEILLDLYERGGMIPIRGKDED